MVHIQRQRAAAGKPTAFERNGKIVRIDQYLRKNGVIICDLSQPSSPNELPSTVRCCTPPTELLLSPGPLSLKELLMRCLKNLTPSFSQLKRPADGKFAYTTELWDTPRYLKLACDLFSENRHQQAGSICHSAFNGVHALVNPPRLDTFFNFVVSQLWWANRDITLELWRYLGAYMSNVLGIRNEVYHFIRGLVEHIEMYGYESYLEFVTECIDDILISKDDGRTHLWRADSHLVGWCQLVVMGMYLSVLFSHPLEQVLGLHSVNVCGQEWVSYEPKLYKQAQTRLRLSQMTRNGQLLTVGCLRLLFPQRAEHTW